MLAALVALAGQLALGAVAVPDQSPRTRLAALDAASILCRSGNTPGDRERPPAHHEQDRASFPLSVAVALPAPSGPLLPAAGGILALRPVGLPQARAPPARASPAAYPRGPPILV